MNQPALVTVATRQVNFDRKRALQDMELNITHGINSLRRMGINICNLSHREVDQHNSGSL